MKDRKTAYSDISKKRYGRLVAEYPTERSKNGSRIWHCSCDCGNTVEATARDLNRGAVKSCGCLKHRPPEPYHSISSNLHFVEGTCIENLIASQKRPVKSSTGVRGVYRQTGGNGYVATIGFQGKTHYIGKFARLGDAAAARRRAEEELYEPFLREHGLPYSKNRK